MKKLLLPALLFCGSLFAAESVTKAPVVHAGIFTDGVSSVVRQFTPAPGDVIIDEEISPIEGTLAVTPFAGTTLTNVVRKIRTSTENPFEDIGSFFRGKSVTVTLHAAGGGQPAVYSGVLYAYGNYITLQDKDSFVSFREDRIADIVCNEIPSAGEVEKQVWLFSHKSRIGGPTFISYLTDGLQWTPAMRLTLLPENKMEIRRSATISNNLCDLQDTELVLFSGSPNIDTRQAVVPKRLPARNKSAVFASAASEDSFQAAPESGTTEDIQALSIGKFSLKKGNTLFLPLNSAETTFERIVVWNIQDKRDLWGRPNRNSENVLYDAISFTNPFKEALCGSLTHVVDGDKELGLVRSNWINPGEKATLNVSKCFTVTGSQREYEPQSENGKSFKGRTTEYIAGYNYFKATVNGEIILKNHRKSAAKLKITQQFSGELVSCDTPHKLTYTNSGIHSVNPQGNLQWELELPAGQEKKITYQYSVLVRQ